jgi:transporter family-2 protein
MSRKNQRLDFLAAISGLLIALQARANGELSHLIGNGVQAALVSFGSGLLIIAIVAVFSPSIKEGARNLKGAVARKELPKWTLFAGALGFFGSLIEDGFDGEEEFGEIDGGPFRKAANK